MRSTGEPDLDTQQPAEGNYFVSTYPPFSCWDEPGAGAFARRLQRPGGAAPLGLYLHVPFCVKRCDFCYYLSYAHRGEAVTPYLDAVERELRHYREQPAVAGRNIAFAYIGGGTPSLLSVARTRSLLDAVQRHVGLDTAAEVTFECAPASTTRDKLEVLRDGGVTRISLGVQQLDDEVLRKNGRVHLIEDVLRAYEAARAVGFAVVNLDLIVGLVGQTEQSFRAGLDAALALAPESITLYQLEVPHNTPLYRARRDGEPFAPRQEQVQCEPSAVAAVGWPEKRAWLLQGYRTVAAAGYTWRSAYTAVRDPARHGFVYQDALYAGADLIGVGASAFGYLDGVHHQNLASLERYLDLEGWREGLPLWRGHVLGATEQVVRAFVLQLKLGAVDLAELERRFGAGAGERFSEVVAGWQRRGLARRTEHAVELTAQGMARVDQLIPACYLPEHRGVRYA